MVDLIIIGAGASGLSAAITARRAGASVLVLEQKEKIGKKLYATGNGKCNFTNRKMENFCYHGASQLIAHATTEQAVAETLAFFESIGIPAKEKDGYYYPLSEQASSIVAALTDTAEALGVRFALNTKVTGIAYDEQGKKYQIKTEGQSFSSSKLIIACGLMASPQLGSDGSLLPVLRSMGYTFTPIVPSLCGFYCKGATFNKLAGVRAQGKVTVLVQGYQVATDTGELQLTDYGISGIPVFQVSRYISLALEKKDQVEVELSFLPELSEDELSHKLSSFLHAVKNKEGSCSYRRLLQGYLPEKLGVEIARKLDHSMEDFAEEGDLFPLVCQIKHFMVHPKRPRDFEFAQVCAGGLDTELLNSTTLESNLHPGMYFAGEILDVDGICGGYNLHFAWITGKIAGSHAAEIC